MATGQVQEALLHIAEVDADIADLRATAVHQRDPMHTMVFDSKGVLLNANKAALDAFHRHASGDLFCTTVSMTHV